MEIIKGDKILMGEKTPNGFFPPPFVGPFIFTGFPMVSGSDGRSILSLE